MTPRTTLLGIMPLLLLTSASRADHSPAMPGGELKILAPDGQAIGACPLKHTDVEADISGFVSRVRVRQTFYNPLDKKIEAVYVFPLPQDGAVDDMVMTVGDRRIIGQIKKRDEARQIYETARSAGHVASLLDEERPNIFTQSVANIEPGARVEIEISYVDTLKYEDGNYEFVFPMVVGPRYVPGQPTSQVPAPSPELRGKVAELDGSIPAGSAKPKGDGWAPDTDQVPDASRITPPVAKPGFRAGHDISLTVRLDAGMPLQDVHSTLHEVAIEKAGQNRATITLKNQAEIPNRDFILSYRTAGDRIEDAFLTHNDERGAFFTLILQPPQRVMPQEVVARELIFVLDTSGSMSGFPIEKAKEVMSRAIDGMRPRDTFNVITFAGSTQILWDEPRPNTPENRSAAQALLASQRGGGGTEMMRAIEAALVQTAGAAAGMLTPEGLADLPADGRAVAVRVPSQRLEHWPPPNMRSHWQGICIRLDNDVVIEVRGVEPAVASMELALHGRWETINHRRVLTVEHFERAGEGGSAAPIRIVCFMTDGYVGNDMAIIEAVKNNAHTTRVFSFGIGNSVNRFLLDGMARAGRGEVEYVTLTGQAGQSVARFQERISAPVLTDIAIDFGTVPVQEIYPKQIPDLFSSKPLMVHGRLSGPAAGTVRLTGNTGAGRFERAIELSPLADPQAHNALASLWARAAVADLEMRDYAGMQNGTPAPEVREQITALGLKYRLVTTFTSFVAVEELTVTAGGAPTKITVPVEMPDGVSYEGVFGKQKGDQSGLQVLSGSAGYYGGVASPSSARQRLSRPVLHDGRVEAVMPAPGGYSGAASADGASRLIEGDEETLQPLNKLNNGQNRRNDPQAKLAEVLRGLAEKVEREGLNGKLTIGGLRVIDYRVDILVQLSNSSQEVIDALKALGFVQAAESKTVQLVIGSIDVRKLIELAELDAVLRVSPVIP